MTTLSEAYNNFLFHCKFEKGLSEKTSKFYKIDLIQFEQFLLCNSYTLNIKELERDHLKMYLQFLSQFKPKTIKRKIATLKAFFNYLEFEDAIVVSPFRKMKVKIKEPTILPKALNQSEMRAIFKVGYQALYEKKNSDSYSYFENLRNVAVLEMLFATGVRVSELVNLRIEDVNLKQGYIKVYGKGSKERIVQLCTPETIKLLITYSDLLKQRKSKNIEFFFVNRLGKRLSDQSVRVILKKYSKNALISSKVTPHTFRHTFATLLLENDVDIKYIQSFLGHSSIATTQIYTHVTKSKQRKILFAKHPRRDFSLVPLTKDN